MNTPSPIKSTNSEIWRGRAEIWTSEGWYLGLLHPARVSADTNEISVYLPKKQINFSVADVVEVRFFRYPMPSMTLIFANDGGYGLVSFFRFTKRSRERFLSASGLTLTSQHTWRTGLEAGRDQKKYLLSA